MMNMLEKKEKLIGSQHSSYIQYQNLAIQSILDEISRSRSKPYLNSEI